MAKYGTKAQKIIQKTMEEYSEGNLRSGAAKNRVRSRTQAVAIGISKARKAGAKVPRET